MELKIGELKEKFSNLSVLVVGDMFLDIDYIGGYSGYSREKEQLPIFRAETEKHSPGGAGNLAVCFATLGIKTTVAGYRGSIHDPNWHKLEKCFRNHNIATTGMKFCGRTPTFGKCYLHNGQHIYRIDLISEPIQEVKQQALVDIIPFMAKHNDFVACADYEEVLDYGVCSPEVIEAVRQNAKVKFATSRKYMQRFEDFDYLIQNRKEVDIADINIECLCAWVKTGLIVTDSGKGAKAYFVGAKRDVVVKSKELTGNIDPCGCGDMFYASYASSIMAGVDTATSLQIANSAARVVARKLFGTGQANVEEITKEWEYLYDENTT